jgi:hypothetical protein
MQRRKGLMRHKPRGVSRRGNESRIDTYSAGARPLSSMWMRCPQPQLGKTRGAQDWGRIFSGLTISSSSSAVRINGCGHKDLMRNTTARCSRRGNESRFDTYRAGVRPLGIRSWGFLRALKGLSKTVR